MKELPFEEVPVGGVVEMDVFGKPTLFTKLHQNSTRYNCFCMASMAPGYIDLDTTVKVVGKLSYSTTQEVW